MVYSYSLCMGNKRTCLNHLKVAAREDTLNFWSFDNSWKSARRWLPNSNLVSGVREITSWKLTYKEDEKIINQNTLYLCACNQQILNFQRKHWPWSNIILFYFLISSSSLKIGQDRRDAITRIRQPHFQGHLLEDW